MYMTLPEKYNFINEDFKKSGLYRLGELPEGRKEADQFFQAAIREASRFLIRYKDKNVEVYNYAYGITSDYMTSIENDYKDRFIGGTNVRNRKTKTAKN